MGYSGGTEGGGAESTGGREAQERDRGSGQVLCRGKQRGAEGSRQKDTACEGQRPGAEPRGRVVAPQQPEGWRLVALGRADAGRPRMSSAEAFPCLQGHRVPAPGDTTELGSVRSLPPGVGLPERKGGGSSIQAGSKRRQGCDNHDLGLGLGWLCRCRLCIA